MYQSIIDNIIKMTLIRRSERSGRVPNLEAAPLASLAYPTFISKPAIYQRDNKEEVRDRPSLLSSVAAVNLQLMQNSC